MYLQLMKETGARIDVDREELGGEQMLLISGFPVQVCRAKAAIHQILTESALVSEQFFVPQRVVGRIIGTLSSPRFPGPCHSWSLMLSSTVSNGSGETKRLLMLASACLTKAPAVPSPQQRRWGSQQPSPFQSMALSFNLLVWWFLSSVQSENPSW